ncbi:hypothetical protein BH23CHL2_BH23CHL2_12780 [soil metagenome]
MMSDDPLDREQQIADAARQFLGFIEVQTGSVPPAPDSLETAGLLDAIEALDRSLDQLADLADVYGADRLRSIEPLVLPSAALVGEYLRAAAGATWIEPIIDADTTLLIAMPDGVAVDLTGAVRASMMSGVSNLRMMVDRLLNPESP